MPRKSKKILKKSKKTKKPIVNDVRAVGSNNSMNYSVNYGSSVFYSNYSGIPQVSYSLLYKYLMESPEVISVVSAITEDIISDGYKFEGGRNKRLKAEKFCQDNRFKEKLQEFLIDALATGDSYFYIGKLSETEVKSRIYSIVSKLPFHFKSEASEALMMEIKQTDLLLPKSISVVPSSTLIADYNKYGEPIKYIQRVGQETETFSPENIIHFRLMKVNGKFYGYSPLQSLVKEMKILENIKTNSANRFDKGGVPPKIFVLKDETPDSPNAIAVKNSLRQYQSLDNKYRNLVFTGDVDVIDLTKPEDMQYKELARYITQVIVMTFGVPASRLSDLLISSGIKGANISSEGYYRKISHMQDVIEDLLNKELFSSFGVKFKFNRTYKQDEIREVQIHKIKADIAQQLLTLGLVNKEWAWEFLNIDEKHRGKEISIPEPKKKLPSVNNQDLINNHQLLSESTEKLQDDINKQGANLRKL